VTLRPEAWKPMPEFSGKKPRPLPPLARRLMRAGFPHPQDLAAFRATLPSVITVTIATPCDDGHKLCYWQSLVAAAQARLPGITLRIWTPPGDSLVPRGRNRLLHEWYYCTVDHFLLTIDSDIDFSVDNIVRSVTPLLPIRAGLYAIKEENLRWCLNAIEGEDVCPQTRLHRVATAGTGWLCYHRSVVGAMIAAAPYWKHWRIDFLDDFNQTKRHLLYAHAVVDDPKNFDHSPRELSEDWSFCYYARALGYDVWADHEIITLHRGECFYPRQARRMTPEEAAASLNSQPSTLNSR
jgi:hypothetical protein